MSDRTRHRGSEPLRRGPFEHPPYPPPKPLPHDECVRLFKESLIQTGRTIVPVARLLAATPTPDDRDREVERLRSALKAIQDKAMVAPFHRRLGRAIGEIHSITVSALGGAPVHYREPNLDAGLRASGGD